MIDSTKAYLITLVIGITVHTSAQTIDCDNVETCNGNSLSCDTINNVNCVIQCWTASSCEEAIFTGGVGDMEINCGNNACNHATFNGGDGTMTINCAQGACSGTTWNGGNGDLIGTCTGSNSCDEGNKYCPAGKYCNITCAGSNACGPGNINRNSGDGNTKLNIIASGSDALEGVGIYCPKNYIRGGQTNNCNIYGYNTPGAWMMTNLKIYAVEGFHDVNIVCDNGNDGCFEQYQSNTRARLYCTEALNTFCTLAWNSSFTNLECYNPSTSICIDYLIPTSSPTVQPTHSPTTAIPTTAEPTLNPTTNPTPSPTRYDPNSNAKILYVSESGCDYGYCMQENYTNYDNETDNFDYCGYNDVCCNNITSSTPSCQETIDAWEANKGLPPADYGWYPGDKIVSVTNTGEWSDSVIGDDGSEDETRDLIRVVCFQIQSPFICADPRVSIEFEDISYAYNVPYHFNVSYQNESAIASCSGGSGTKRCGSWYECAVDMQPNDGPWIADGGGHAFWVTDSQGPGQVWRPVCFSPERTFNVRVSVNCSATTDIIYPPRCRTLDYTWDCFHGIGGAPVDTVCRDVGYDGNGEIHISDGLYTFNHNMYVQNPYQQVIISGRGCNKTFLNQIISAENVALSCDLCNLTMSGFTYLIEPSGSASVAENIIIEISNGGNATFDEIDFISDMKPLEFIFSDYCHVKFINCRFPQNVMFNISNSATVLFEQCLFINISQQNTVISVKNSELLIKESVFSHNNALDSVIQSFSGSDIVIQDSTFAKNVNISYIWHLFASKGSMKNTTNVDNECTQDYCISAVDSDLLIDETSVIDYYLNDTYDIQMVEFGHSENDTTNFNTLFLWNFKPESISPNIDLFNFYSENGRILFVPCIPFETALTQNLIFDEVSEGLIPTRLYNESGAFDGEIFSCNFTAICYIECVVETLTCFRSQFTAVTVENALFKCESSSSCQEGMINISSSVTSAVLCGDSSACEKMKIYVDNVDNFTLECILADSCSEIEIFITNAGEANIKCYAENACDGMRVISDSNEVGIHIEMWSKDIIISLPSQYCAEYLHCNDNAYLSLDGDTFESLETSIAVLVGDNMPCSDVTYSFQSETVDCEIRYQMYANHEINELLTYLEDYVECFPSIYINEFLNYSCFGSVSPTKFPTSGPTLQPSFDPTSAPTLAPSASPTQYPTSSDAFGDRWLDLDFDLKNLSVKNLQTIVSDVLILKKNQIERIISESYVASGTNVGLEYREFQVIILRLSGIDANSKDLNINNLKKASAQIWNSVSRRRLLANDLYNVRLTTHIDVDLTATGSAIVVLSESPDFRNITRNKLRKYFENEDVEFIVNPEAVPFEIKEQIPIEDSDLLLYVLIAFVSVVCLMALADFIYNQLSKTRADDTNFIAIMIYGLQMWDMLSDFILSFEITNKLLADTSNVFLLIASIGSITFVVVPYFCNLLIAVNIKKFISNSATRAYLETRSSFFITLCTFSGGAYASLSLISSQIFGLEMFNCGLTQYELMKLGKLKIFGTILLENLPQMIFQLLYVYALKTAPTENTWLAFITSLLSIISSILTYWMNKSSVGGGGTTQYYISFENEHIALSKEHKKQISANKLKTRKLTVAITSEFGIYDRDIEIGKCRVTSHGLSYHIIHHLHDGSQMTSPKLYIMELYSKQKHFDTINDIFGKHFGFSKIQNADDTFRISIQHTLGDTFDSSNMALIDKMMTVLSNDANADTNNINFKTEASKLLERFLSTDAIEMQTVKHRVSTLSDYELNKLEAELDDAFEIKREGDMQMGGNTLEEMDVTVGDMVQLRGDNLVGNIRFIGNIIGKKGVFYGIELSVANGKNDGSVKNVSYFRCDRNKGIFVKKQRIEKRLNQVKIGKVRATYGDIVTVKKFDCDGTVRYIGTPNGKKGVWYGIELYDAKGKNNGSVKGREYFKCLPHFGTFVTAQNIIVQL